MSAIDQTFRGLDTAPKGTFVEALSFADLVTRRLNFRPCLELHNGGTALTYTAGGMIETTVRRASRKTILLTCLVTGCGLFACAPKPRPTAESAAESPETPRASNSTTELNEELCTKLDGKIPRLFETLEEQDGYVAYQTVFHQGVD
jgi:hypothetical protein